MGHVPYANLTNCEGGTRVRVYDVANDERLVIDRLHRSRLRIEGARAAGSCA